MFFSIHDLELRKVEFAETIVPGVIDMGPETIQKSPIKTDGRAELLREHHGGNRVVEDIRVLGSYSTKVELKCARCVEPVAYDVASDFDLLYRPLSTMTREDDVAINEAESEIGYYQGEGVLLEDVLKEQIFLSVPIRMLCRDDCKGLCLQCGQNRNTDPCECKDKGPDVRWTPLADIKDKLKR